MSLAPGRGRRLFLALQLPLIAVWTLLFAVAECGDGDQLDSRTLREGVYPTARRMQSAYGDFRFRARGPQPTRHKIVIVEIDDAAVSQLARWPWHRDAIAALVLQVMEAGAKVVGLDVVFPEADQRVPDGVAELMTAHGLADQIPQFETDLVLQRIIDLYKDRLVLGWMTDTWCRPRWSRLPCPVAPAEALAGFEKFGYQRFAPPSGFDPATTHLVSTPTLVGNLPGYEQAALHAGYLVNAAEEPDEIVRRAQLAIFFGGRPFPSLPLAMARVGLGGELGLALDDSDRVARIELTPPGRRVAVNGGGVMTINFRGPGYHFPYVGAIDLLGEEDVIPVQHDGVVEHKPRAEIFGDAYVFIGVTAIGARDLRNFPFGSNVPGTEGLATILDNILAGDAIRPGAGLLDWRLVLALMTLGALGFGALMVRLSALPAMLSALATIGVVAVLDVYVVFGRWNVGLNTVFLLGELATLFVATVAVKYVVEERGKRFIRSTFSKYLAPSVVDQMLSDPKKLQLGGETRRLTIMMSDLRGFTAMAERMKPAEVLTVLNHYLGTMADIIVAHNGTIDEFIGDAILVIFGAPIEGKDDARRAVACAIAMQQAMVGINEHNARLGLPRLEMGIAVNTGEVIVGNIGSQKHIKYGVVGSHVNLTARIESNTVGGQVLVSGSTLELAGPDVVVGDKQLITAKGFAEPIPAHDVRGIGGEYALHLPEVDLELVALATPVEVRARVMTGKNEEGPEQVGTLVQLSGLGATLELPAPAEALTNLKLRLVGDGGALVDGDLYGKVTTGGARCVVRFTAVPPAVAAFIAARCVTTATITPTTTAEADPAAKPA